MAGIAGEELTHVRRHADARHLVVRVAAEESKLWAGISDNGRGIALASVTPGVQHGITGMHERTDLCVGRLGIRSQSGGGTAIPFEADFTNGEYGLI